MSHKNYLIKLFQFSAYFMLQHIFARVHIFDLNVELIYLTYMGVFDLGQTRGFCSDGVIRPLDFCVPLLLLLKGKVITSSFFRYVPSPWSKSQKRKGNQRGQMTIA